MRAIIKQPWEKYGNAWNFDCNDLNTLQAIVGGYIERVYLHGQKFNIICNEEGKLNSLPFNMRHCNYDYLVGTIVVTGECDEHGEFTSITDDDVVNWHKFVDECNKRYIDI